MPPALTQKKIFAFTNSNSFQIKTYFKCNKKLAFEHWLAAPA
jgi:hypothetical protein